MAGTAPYVAFTVAGAAPNGFTVSKGVTVGVTVGTSTTALFATGRGKNPPSQPAIVGLGLVGYCILPNAHVGSAIVGTSQLAA